MQGQSVPADGRALAPVVGIVLLLAITVLLGATAAAFVFGAPDDELSDGPPTTKFVFEYEQRSGSDTMTIRHDSGDDVTTASTYVVLEDARCVGGSDDPDGEYSLADAFALPGSEMNAGMTVQLRPDTDFDGTRELCTGGSDLSLSDASVEIIWDGEDAGTTMLAEWPDG